MEKDKITVGILSLGCPKNLVDSEVILGFLKHGGYAIRYDVTECDVAILNTCAFVRDAKQESVEMISELCRLKAEGRIQFIVVCGCLPQRYTSGYGTCMNEVDGYIGLGQINNIVAIVDAVVQGHRVINTAGTTYVYDHTSPRFMLTPSFVKYIKIAEGCNHKCSFCIIPDIRGPYVSRPIESIVSEVRHHVAHGLREAVIISQDTTYYGKELYGEYKLADLLRELNAIEGLEWIRVLYMYPRNITQELISVITSCDKICNYVDLALQHINDDILRSMRRGISSQEIRDVIARLRREIPGLVLRTTFIVGYPGEGYSEFNELLDFVDEMRFERMGAFMYSAEEGTHAADLLDSVPEDVKKSRFQDIMLLQQSISREKNSALSGKVFKTLIEGTNRDIPDYLIGRTYMDAPDIDGWVYVKKTEGLDIGRFYNVKITDSSEYDLIGEAVSD